MNADKNGKDGKTMAEKNPTIMVDLDEKSKALIADACRQFEAVVERMRNIETENAEMKASLAAERARRVSIQGVLITLLGACYAADAAGELSERITGGMMDAAHKLTADL